MTRPRWMPEFGTPLTPKELRVLRLVASGRTYAQAVRES